MPWNGSGTFNRIYSWVADKAAGLDISSSRMDTDSNDIAANGFGNCITRDGQGQPTANLPMANFRHTNVGNGAARTDYAALQQAQDGLLGWTTAGGTSDAITAAYTPSQGAPQDGQLYRFRATAANATTTPTFAPNGQTARTITKNGGLALAVGDIPGNLAEVLLCYNAANTRYELLNPIFNDVGTGDVKITLKTAADTGWLLFDDTTMGSATSGANNASALNQALFILLYNNTTDASCPVLTSGGGATTRGAQGTAAQAWAANCRMTLPKVLGRALAGAGSGSGLTARPLGSNTGAETHALTAAELPSNIPYTDAGHTHSLPGAPIAISGPSNQVSSGTGYELQSSTTGSSTTGITINPSGGNAHTIVQPTSFFNVMVKQ